MANEKPTVVKIHDINIDKDYVQWPGEIKSRYRSAQIKAAVNVNAEKLRFNWELGRDLVRKKAEERWGAGVVEQLSLDLQAAFPESKGFSLSNLWRMKQWYLFYAESSEKLARLGRELTTSGKLAQVVQELQLSENHNFEKLAQPMREFPAILGLVPWGHHIDIIAHCKSLEEAFFYLSKTETDCRGGKDTQARYAFLSHKA